MKKRHALPLLLLLLSFLFLALLFVQIPTIEEGIKQNIKDDSVRSIAQVMENFEDDVAETMRERNATSLYTLLRSDPHLRFELEGKLNLLITAEFQYIYMLYREEGGKYRFLLDGASQDKARFNSKFDIEDEAWNTAYLRQEIRLLEQHDMPQVWITYLKPVIFEGETQGIVAVDFSLERYKDIVGIIRPLKQTLTIVFGLIGVIGLITLVQYALFYFARKKAYLDPLTAMHNRQFLNDTLCTLNYQKYIFAMIDLDRFKQINDTYGHSAGDRVLRRVSQLLKESIRDEDMLVRYGGEEFLMLLPQRGLSEVQAVNIMERIREKMEAITVTYEGMKIRPTISIGVNAYSDHFKNEHDAIAAADQMLYAAKQNGRNRVTSFNPDYCSATDENGTFSVHHVKEALEEERLFCEYQPIIDSVSGRIDKYEALVRIRGRDGRTVYPGTFLPNIKYSTIYKEMTKRLIEINFELVRREKVHVSINLNITDILDDDIYGAVMDRLTDMGSDSRYFTFELLEEEQIRDIDLLRQHIATIHAMGASIAIDDFGSGYSNFLHVLSLDIDIIKIDGSLIKDIHTSEVSRQLVVSITAFAKASNKDVVAEFVHCQEVYAVVKSLGIRCMQGFYLAKPTEALQRSAAVDIRPPRD